MPHDGQDIAELFNKALTEQPVLANVGQIEDVEATTKNLFRTTYRRTNRIVWLVSLGLTAVIIAISIIFRYDDGPGFLILPLSIVLIWYAGIKNQVREEFMKQFARAYAYNFHTRGSVAGRQG